MKFLEVTAFPPKIYGVSGTEAQSHNNWYQTLKGSLSYILSGNQTDSLILAEPQPRQLTPTILNVTDFNGGSHSINMGTAWFPEIKGTARSTDYTANVTDGGGNVLKTMKGDLLSDLTACNMQNNVINYWEVPDMWIDYTAPTGPYLPTDDVVKGFFPSVTSKVNNTTYTYSAATFNKKAGYSQSVRIRMYSAASGNSLEKNIYDPLPGGSVPTGVYSLLAVCCADIRPDGYPLACWAYADNGADQRSNPVEYIRGGNWRKIALTNNGLAGSYFSQLGLINNRANTAMGAMAAIGGGLIMGGAGLAGHAAANALDRNIRESTFNPDANKAYTNQQANLRLKSNNLLSKGTLGLTAGLAGATVSLMKLAEQDDLLSRQGICAATPQFTNNSDFIKDIDKNNFAFIISRYSDSDLANYDELLTRIGYNVGNMRVTNRHFYSRKNFVYVKANEDLKLIGNGYSGYCVGANIIEKVQQQLQRGVRIWRKKPNAYNLLADGNNEINPDAYRPYN